MGRYSHHAIVVSCILEKPVRQAHVLARKIFRGLTKVSPVLVTRYGQASFFIAPDGSKEGWGHSNKCNEAREKFAFVCLERSTLSCVHPDYFHVDWIEVEFGGDNDVCAIRADSLSV